MAELESSTQHRIAAALRARGALVLVTTPGPGIPIGTPDLIGVLPGGRAFAMEVKRPGRSSEDCGGSSAKQRWEAWEWAARGAVVLCPVDDVAHALDACGLAAN